MPAAYEPEQLGTTVAGQITLIRAAADCGFPTGELARFFSIEPRSVSRAKYDRDT